MKECQSMARKVGTYRLSGLEIVGRWVEFNAYRLIAKFRYKKYFENSLEACEKMLPFLPFMFSKKLMAKIYLGED